MLREQRTGITLFAMDRPSSFRSKASDVIQLAWLPALFVVGLSVVSMAIVAEFPSTQSVADAFSRSRGDGLGGRKPRVATPAVFPIAERSEMSKVIWIRGTGQSFTGEGQPDPHDPELPYVISAGEPSIGIGYAFICGNARI